MNSIWIVLSLVQLIQLFHIYQIYELRKDVIDLQRGRS